MTVEESNLKGDARNVAPEDTDQREPSDPQEAGPARLPIIRSGVAGVLMGLANLVPGVSGGTMIVVMGLYDEFITSVADVTRLRFTKRGVLFLAILCCAALVAIGALAGLLSRAVTLHRTAMFALFIGMTLGGAPLLIRMLQRFSRASVVGIAVGLALMLAIVFTREPPPDEDALKEAVAAGRLVIEPSYTRDAVAGALGMSAMVLPGISGAYMLLILGRYETILAAVSMTESYIVSAGGEGDPAVFLRVMIPVVVGAAFSLVFLSNFLKWMLHRHRSFTIGLLLGILFGSVVGIWPFDAGSQPVDFAIGAGLAAAGFIATVVLSRIGA
jgi:putative membrane protein